MSHVNLALPGSALQRGFSGCSNTLANFGKWGDLAIGTLSEKRGLFTLRGEQAWTSSDTDCSAVQLSLNDDILDGAIVRFSSDFEEEVNCPPGPNQFVTMISNMTPSPNYAYAVCVSGEFSLLRITSLTNDWAARDIPEAKIRRLEHVHGSLLGFYFPLLLEDVAWAGYRFHFLSSNHTIAGRLLDCEIAKPLVALHHLDECRIAFPKTSDFQLTDF